MAKFDSTQNLIQLIDQAMNDQMDHEHRNLLLTCRAEIKVLDILLREARQEICELKSFNFERKITPQGYAELRKWNCFNTGSGIPDHTNGVTE